MKMDQALTETATYLCASCIGVLGWFAFAVWHIKLGGIYIHYSDFLRGVKARGLKLDADRLVYNADRVVDIKSLNERVYWKCEPRFTSGTAPRGLICLLTIVLAIHMKSSFAWY